MKTWIRTPTYACWDAMIQRCTNPKNPKYAHYGGRGVTVCIEWRNSYKAFLRDMGERPAGLSLDRRENNLGYSKDNCRWATLSQQNLNRRRNSNNKTGITGVRYDLSSKWIASITIKSKDHILYRGTDFLEACCRRKAWDAQYGKT